MFLNFVKKHKKTFLHLCVKVILPARLEMRRIQNDLIWCYKILFGHVKICSPNFFEFRLSSTRGHTYKLFKYNCSNTTRSVFFAERVINA